MEAWTWRLEIRWSAVRRPYYASAAMRSLAHHASLCGADKDFAGWSMEGCHPLASQGHFDETSCSIFKFLFAAQLSTLGEDIRVGQRPPSYAAASRKLVRTADGAGVCGVCWHRHSGLLRNRRSNFNRTHATYKAAGPPNHSACARYGETRENLQFLRVTARDRTSSVAISL